jgi:superfamily II DNA or RNA helicase
MPTEREFSKAVVSSHLFVPKAEVRGLGARKKELTLVSRFEKGDGRRATIPLFRETGQWFGFPRYFFPVPSLVASEVNDITSVGQEIEFSFQDNPSFSKFAEQQAMLRKFKSVVIAGGTGFLLVAPTGYGKSIIMIQMIQIIGGTALIVVPKEDLMYQWKQRLLEFTSLRERQIGFIQQDTCDFQGKSVVIGMLQSLALRKREYPKEMFSYFGVVLFDESHRASAEKLHRAIGKFRSRYRICGSATPKRLDGLDVVLRYHIAQHTIGTDVDDMPAPKVFIKSSPYQRGSIPIHLGKIQRKGVLTSKLAGSPQRTVLISACVKSLYAIGRRVLVVSDRLKQLEHIRLVLVNKFEVPSGEIGKYVGGTSNKDRGKIVAKARIILATYGAIELGTDIPSMSALVLATPRSTATQVVGRIRRIAVGKGTPVVVDIVDSAYPDCTRMLRGRLRDYKKMSASVTFVGKGVLQ